MQFYLILQSVQDNICIDSEPNVCRITYKYQNIILFFLTKRICCDKMCKPHIVGLLSCAYWRTPAVARLYKWQV